MNSEFSAYWLLYAVAAIGVVVVFFFIFREIVLWYFRINQMADDLHSIANHFREEEKKAAPPAQSLQPQQLPPTRPRPSISSANPSP